MYSNKLTYGMVWYFWQLSDTSEYSTRYSSEYSERPSPN